MKFQILNMVLKVEGNRHYIYNKFNIFRHLGPVYSINRSPIPKYFMSVGDWSCKVWVEDLKTPIIRTKYHGAYLSDGCWSPTRNGAFFLIRRDGIYI